MAVPYLRSATRSPSAIRANTTFPRVPESLISKPTLVWLVQNGLLATQKVEASYLTNGISWRSDYVVTLNDKDDRADLSGWVTIENKSGATYKDAKLKLVAGDVNRVKGDNREMLKMARNVLEAASAPQFKEDSFFEYHLHPWSPGNGQGEPDQADQPGAGCPYSGQKGIGLPGCELLLPEPVRGNRKQPENRRFCGDR